MFLIVLLLALFISIPAHSASYIVTRVIDGDTVKVKAKQNKEITCRLYGIDAPEVAKKNQAGMPFGQESADELSRMILGRLVDVSFTGDASYNRNICIIYSPKGTNINLEMVRLGWAWAYVQYLKRPHASEFLKAEEEARKAKRGLWQQTNPIPPWEWRKRNNKIK